MARADDGPLSGAVVDFIDLGWWPVFNIADSAIVVGVVAMMLMAVFEKPDPDPHSDQKPDTDTDPGADIELEPAPQRSEGSDEQPVDSAVGDRS